MSTTINENYPTADAMLVVDETNEPIESASIRIFEYVAFQAGVVDTWVAETLSDADGKWIDPIVLPDGETWIVQFQKYSAFGPVHVEITT